MERRREGGRNERADGRSGSRRNHEESLPEWATEGPTDVNDTIELKGFADASRKKQEQTAAQAGKPAPEVNKTNKEAERAGPCDSG